VTRDFSSVRTQEQIAEVTSPSECSRRGQAGIYPGNDPRIVLGSTVAGPQLAPGFKGFGIIRFISAGGAVVAAGGSGVSTGVIAGVAAGGAAAAGVGVLAASGGSSASGDAPTGAAPISVPPPITPTAPVSTPPPTEDVEACFMLNLLVPVIEVNQVLTIDGRCSSGGAGLSYRYDLGDGRVKEGQPFVTVIWPNPGIYTLTLTVTRSAPPFGGGLQLVDEDTFSQTITVTEPPAPPSEPTGADLQLTKTAFPSSVGSGALFTWSLTVTNLGPGVATDVIVLDKFPPGPDVEDTPSGCNVSGGEVSGYTVDCRIGVLQSGQSITLDFDMQAPFVEQSQTFVNNATVSSASMDPDTSNNGASAAVAVTPFRESVGSVRTSMTSDLDAAPRNGATMGSIVLNGAAVAMTNNASPIRFQLTGKLGKNVIEAHLASSTLGEIFWRFDFTAAQGFMPNGFIVESGQVVSRDARSIVFRLDGRDQRIRFSFILETR